jgi:hypothetical protein
MNEHELKEFMIFRKDGERKIPLAVFEINGSYILGVYQGSFSEFDILVKYRQKVGDSWSRIRTPKHIHWAVDVLIKLHEDRTKTQSFLDFLIDVWNNTRPVKNKNQQQVELTVESLLQDCQTKIKEYENLSSKGEYSVKFLIMLAKLLMIQEKTNLETAYMFKNLLEALRKGEDIFSIVSIATHTGR